MKNSDASACAQFLTCALNLQFCDALLRKCFDSRQSCPVVVWEAHVLCRVWFYRAGLLNLIPPCSTLSRLVNLKPGEGSKTIDSRFAVPSQSRCYTWCSTEQPKSQIRNPTEVQEEDRVDFLLWGWGVHHPAGWLSKASVRNGHCLIIALYCQT